MRRRPVCRVRFLILEQICGIAWDNCVVSRTKCCWIKSWEEGDDEIIFILPYIVVLSFISRTVFLATFDCSGGSIWWRLLRDSACRERVVAVSQWMKLSACIGEPGWQRPACYGLHISVPIALLRMEEEIGSSVFRWICCKVFVPCVLCDRSPRCSRHCRLCCGRRRRDW